MSAAPRPVRSPIAVLIALALAATGCVAVLLATAPAAEAASRAQVMSAAAAYGQARGYRVGIAVYDTRTHQSYGSGYHSSTFATESVIKAMIATRLLLTGRMYGTTASRAYKMIIYSDDAIASSLYGSVGGDSLITWIKNHYGISNLGSPPIRSGWWGNNHITPDGLVRFYAKVKADPKVGPWLINAMHHANRYGSDGFYQFFGIPAATTGFGVKQGWGTDYDDFGNSADENTTGFVNGDRYAVAILARGPVGSYGSRIGAMLTATAKLLLPGGRFPDGTPRITSRSPAFGSTLGGTAVRVTGVDLTWVMGATFGTTRSTEITRLSATTLVVYAPPHAAGLVPMRIITAHGTTTVTNAPFTYVAPPQVTGLSFHTSSVAGGATLTISGTNFYHAAAVYFGATSVPFTALSITSIRAVVPAHAAGPVDLRVRTPYGTSPVTSADRLTYRVPPPVVTSISPTSGPSAGGTTVTVQGSNFTSDSAVVLGNKTVEPTTTGSTSLQFVTPPGTGVVPVRVQTATGLSAVTSADNFSYTP